jgi:hypothetical protein
MDVERIDRIARRIAGIGVTRRAGLRAGWLSLVATAFGAAGAAAQGTPEAETTATPAAPNELEIDGAWLCNQTFALCTTAPCELSADDPTIANCHCIVANAPAIGFKSCAERAQSGVNLASNFSTVNVNSEFAVMSCPEDAPWANCLDVPCEIDPLNPAVATCQCQMVETGPSLTFGGGCDTATCTSTIWSAAPTTYLGLAQYESGMAQVGQEVNLPSTCPAATPVASPVGATPSA